MERCRPGRELRSLEDDAAAMAITADVLRRLWRPAPAGHPFRLLAAMAQEWAATLPRQYEAAGAPYERSLVDEVVEALPALAATQGPAVVLHQDLHGGNILQAQREEWLAIDPKPLVGEREFDLASVLRDRWDELAVHDSQALVQRRFDYLCEVLQMDRQRVRLWGMAHALAWGFSGGGTYEALFNAARLIKGCR
jgi:streptomycin 6-kinase